MKKCPERVPRFGFATGGDLVLGGRRFVFKVDSSALTALHRRLGDGFGLVVAADRRQPLVVLRFGDFLRACRFRGPAGTAGPQSAVTSPSAGQGAPS
jgi:hypothetical protein